jgi:hypothetical protein
VGVGFAELSIIMSISISMYMADSNTRFGEGGGGVPGWILQLKAGF